MSTPTFKEIQDKMIANAKAKTFVIDNDTPASQLVSSQDSSITKKMFDYLDLSPKENTYSEEKPYGDNIVTSLTNLLVEYNKAIISSPNLYKEIALAQSAITNPESFPDGSNPMIHNIVLTPMMAGLVARSVPNMLAPVNNIMGLTAYSSKIERGYDRLRDLFEGKPYVRPQLKFPEAIRTINPNYGIGGSDAPYRDASIPVSIPTYREQTTTNIYSPGRPRNDNTIKEYTETGYNSSLGKIDYTKLFGDSIGNKMFQQPIAVAREKKFDEVRAGSFFNDGSIKVVKRSLEKFDENGNPTQNLTGIVDFNRDPFFVEEVFFPFFIVDLRTRMGVGLKPLGEEFPKDQINVSVEEESYIGRVGALPKWKNATRKVSLNFFIIAESESELIYVQDTANFLKNLTYPIYNKVQDEQSSVNFNLISSSPVIEIRYGNYIYDANSIGVVRGLVGILTSIDVDPFRFPWEVLPNKQVPQGYRCTLEATIINRENPGARINADGTISYTRFQEVTK